MFLNQQNPLYTSHRVAKLCFLLCIAVLCSTLSVTAQTEQKLVASDAAASDGFGHHVAVGGDRAVVGAPQNDDAGASSGAAYVFQLDGISWVEEQKLIAVDGVSGDFFGQAVSVSGDRVLVGANSDVNGNDSGAAYVFRLDNGTWVLEQKLLANDGEAFDRFGRSVAIDGDRAVIGANGDDDIASASGSIYVFSLANDTWVQEQKLLASDGEADDNFGVSVAISGTRIAIGAFGDDDLGSASGSAYVFQLSPIAENSDDSTWVQKQKLLASDGEDQDRFGRQVSISGDRLVVGAIWSDKGTVGNAGGAYVYHFDGTDWLEEEKLTASDAVDGDEFGQAVSISDDRIVVGALNNFNGTISGSAYPFRLDGTTWVEEQKLVPSDGANFDEFGFSVAISGNFIVVGARLDDDTGDGSGSAYVYELAGTSTAIDDAESTTYIVQHLAVYPNPASGPITIEFTSKAGRSSTISILDMLGRKVVEKTSSVSSGGLNRVPVDTSTLAPGVYTVLVKNQDGASSAVFVVAQGN
jgi:hypothetical protein